MRDAGDYAAARDARAAAGQPLCGEQSRGRGDRAGRGARVRPRRRRRAPVQPHRPRPGRTFRRARASRASWRASRPARPPLLLVGNLERAARLPRRARRRSPPTCAGARRRRRARSTTFAAARPVAIREVLRQLITIARRSGRGSRGSAAHASRSTCRSSSASAAETARAHRLGAPYAAGALAARHLRRAAPRETRRRIESARYMATFDRPDDLRSVRLQTSRRRCSRFRRSCSPRSASRARSRSRSDCRSRLPAKRSAAGPSAIPASTTRGDAVTAPALVTAGPYATCATRSTSATSSRRRASRSRSRARTPARRALALVAGVARRDARRLRVDRPARGSAFCARRSATTFDRLLRRCRRSFRARTASPGGSGRVRSRVIGSAETRTFVTFGAMLAALALQGPARRKPRGRRRRGQLKFALVGHRRGRRARAVGRHCARTAWRSLAMPRTSAWTSFALVIALAAAVGATRPADARQTFGFARIEVLAALGNSALLFWRRS